MENQVSILKQSFTNFNIRFGVIFHHDWMVQTNSVQNTQPIINLPSQGAIVDHCLIP